MIVEAIETHPLQIVQEVAALIRPRAVGKGVQLHVVYDTPVPTRITSDPTRLRQILLNLAGNAIKFTEVGSVSIHMSCDPLSERLTLQVVDTGIGMTPEQREANRKFPGVQPSGRQYDTKIRRHWFGPANLQCAGPPARRPYRD